VDQRSTQSEERCVTVIPRPGRADRCVVRPRAARILAPALVVLAILESAASCGGTGAAPSATSASRSRTAHQQVPPPVLRARQALFVRRNGSPHLKFVEWKSEQTANGVIRSLERARGGTLYFAPGRYEVRFGIFVLGVDNITLIGVPGTELVLASPRAVPPPRLLAPATEGQRHLTLDRTNGLSVGGRYQIHPADGIGDRLLEFVVREVDGTGVTLGGPIQFMRHVSAIPEGSVVLEELNFFRVHHANHVVIQGFTLDGLGRGEVLGHTSYCGIIVDNDFLGAQKAGAPLYAGLRVVGNTFKNLKGRGVGVYGTRGVVVQGNGLVNIGHEALEMDHFSSGLVSHNRIRAAAVGIQLDDAFDTVVERNKVEGAGSAVVLLGHFDEPWANTGNRIIGNTFIGPGAIGVFVSERSRNNFIAGNHIKAVKQGIVGNLASNNVDGEEHR